MHWGELVTIIGVNVALISWLRSDMRVFESKIEGWKEQFSRDMASYKEEINKEMKDFHGRMCAIEERNKKRNENGTD